VFLLVSGQDAKRLGGVPGYALPRPVLLCGALRLHCSRYMYRVGHVEDVIAVAVRSTGQACGMCDVGSWSWTLHVRKEQLETEVWTLHR